MSSVNVLGAGVLGMTCALGLCERGHRVTILAADLPTDLDSTGFASPWAGGFWHSFEDDERSRAAGWDREGFFGLQAVAEKHPGIVQEIETYEYSEDELPEDKLPWFYRNLCHNARRLTPADIAAKRGPGSGLNHGIAYSTYSFNPALYLPWLHGSLLSKGVVFVRKRLSAIDEAFLSSSDGDGQVSVVVNATGLGARSLLGVEDEEVLPNRGQTVLIRPPRPLAYSSADGFDRYIISRPSSSISSSPPRDGMEVILGGCYQADNWDVSPDPDLAKRIVADAVKMLPAISKDGTVEGVDIIRHNVGLRPGRRAGPRLESQDVVIPTQSRLVTSKGQKEREVTVVHCYGISGAGYQASWGMAKEVCQLVDTALAKRRRSIA